MKASLFLVPLFLISACSTTKPVHPTLQATLWVQNSVEFDALSNQAYSTATQHLHDAVSDHSWTASLEQSDMDVSKMPEAVILDIDETVLDNSPFQARMVKKNSAYDPIEWEKWVLEANADAIAGAVDFTQAAAAHGITVFYVSNRDANTEEATRRNLSRLGFPISDSDDVVMLKGEQENWTSSKIERRKVIASKYRVLMLFGDDFNDFLPAKYISEAERDSLLDEHKGMFGKKWFLLPNPIYGSWNDAMFNFDRSLSDEEKERIIDEHLRTNN